MGEIVISGRGVELPGVEVDRSLSLLGHSRARLPEEDIHRIILHHDAALSARSCYRILAKRGLSTHFVIDNDGTIYQFLDPGLRQAWASGSVHGKRRDEHRLMPNETSFNRGSVAIDFSNACELRWAKRYKPPRPVLTQHMHRGRVKWLGLYPGQVAACVALCRLLCDEFDIQRAVPLADDGSALLQVLDPVPSGIVGHLHLTRRKYDPFGLDWPAFETEVAGG